MDFMFCNSRDGIFVFSSNAQINTFLELVQKASSMNSDPPTQGQLTSCLSGRHMPSEAIISWQ